MYKTTRELIRAKIKDVESATSQVLLLLDYVDELETERDAFKTDRDYWKNKALDTVRKYQEEKAKILDGFRR